MMLVELLGRNYSLEDVLHSLDRAGYVSPAAPGIDLEQFRDARHLAGWLGSLVDGNEMEEWDAAQAAMQGVLAFSGDAAVIQRLIDSIEGECDGLAITADQASAIFHYVLQPLAYGDEPMIDANPKGGSDAREQFEAWLDSLRLDRSRSGDGYVWNDVELAWRAVQQFTAIQTTSAEVGK